MPQIVLGANGPGKGELPSYLRLISEKTDKFIFANFAQAKVEKVNGVTYNEKNNTLTLNNVKMKEYNLVANIMGDDFKINVKGEQLCGILRPMSSISCCNRFGLLIFKND